MSKNNDNGASMQKRMDLHKEINKNKIDIDKDVFKKSAAEKQRVSKEKSEYKANYSRPKFQSERNDLISAFTHAAKTMKTPKFNIHLIIQ